MAQKQDNAQLSEDIKILGNLLGQVLRSQVGGKFYDKIETIRHLSKAMKNGDALAADQLVKLINNMKTDEVLDVARAFTHFLNLANIAEQHHRIRRTQWHTENGPEPLQPGSIPALFAKLQQLGIGKDEVYQRVCALDINLVFTPHPTEVLRRTLMQKFDRIFHELHANANLLNLKREITAIWLTDTIRHQAPSPIDEAKWCFAVIETSLWQALPKYLRCLSDNLLHFTGTALPLDATPIQFGSWMGGDRDGNPNVTPEITQRVCVLAQWMAMDLYLRDVDKLRSELSMANCSAKMQQHVAGAREPYRAILKELKDKLIKHKEYLEHQLQAKNSLQSFAKANINSAADLLEPLLLCHNSLHATNAGVIADADLLDLIRRIYCFGLSLITIDIRQEASRHRDAIAFIAAQFGVGNYLELSETAKQDFLLQYLQGSKELKFDVSSATKEVFEVLETFKMIKQQPRYCFATYIISMAQQPSDILAVMLLQKWAEIEQPLPVVPLFETLQDLNNSVTCMQKLFSLPWYLEQINFTQEVMIGYSDSAKDAGIMAASWAQYCAVESLVDLAKQYKVKIKFFHGRGGTVGRGGAPTHMAILSQPPGSIDNAIRVTQQGEVIRNRFGAPEIAERTLHIYTTATLEVAIKPGRAPLDSWRKLMTEMATAAKNNYHAYVKENADFETYFNTVTPIAEISKLALGSRPPKRNQQGGIASLRAIPWVFAWTQTRSLLPGWLGVGSGIAHAFQTQQEQTLKQMLKWPFFASLLNMVEMVLAKADFDIVAYYENCLLTQKNLFKVGADLQHEYANTTKQILKLFSATELLEFNPILQRAIKVREPYVLPLHMLQAELLAQLRRQPQTELSPITTALLVTITGIAAGMRNTG